MIPATNDDDIDPGFLWLWMCRHDTYEIAAHFGITEAEAERRVWRAREQRRIAKRGLVNE
jgi:hypothetical protein